MGARLHELAAAAGQPLAINESLFRGDRTFGVECAVVAVTREPAFDFADGVGVGRFDWRDVDLIGLGDTDGPQSDTSPLLAAAAAGEELQRPAVLKRDGVELLAVARSRSAVGHLLGEASAEGREVLIAELVAGDLAGGDASAEILVVVE